MIQLVAFIVYNFLALPIIYIVVHLVALFHKKLRHGVWVRHFQWKRVHLQEGKACVLFHTASLGEYEHIRPLFPRLKQNCDKPKYLVNMFFSPSGYLHANMSGGPDQYIYSPFDTPWAVWRLFHRFKPKILVIAKHDIWPNQVWMAKMMRIPVIVINASLGKKSSRLHWWSRSIHRIIYKNVNTIFTISSSDQDNFSRLVPSEKIKIAGDTKFDQVIHRKEEAEKMDYIPASFWQNNTIFVGGSVWPADLAVIQPGLGAELEQNSNLRLILVPHDPSEKHLTEIEAFFSDVIRFSQLQNYQNEKVVVVDAVGVLASLYKYAQISFVGGGFKEGIHNVMEAAVYGVPVIYGPNISGASEAVAMSKANQGGFITADKEDFAGILSTFLTDQVYLQKSGKEAGQFVQSRVGASDTISRVICDLI